MKVEKWCYSEPGQKKKKREKVSDFDSFIVACPHFLSCIMPGSFLVNIGVVLTTVKKDILVKSCCLLTVFSNTNTHKPLKLSGPLMDTMVLNNDIYYTPHLKLTLTDMLTLLDLKLNDFIKQPSLSTHSLSREHTLWVFPATYQVAFSFK